MKFGFRVRIELSVGAPVFLRDSHPHMEQPAHRRHVRLPLAPDQVQSWSLHQARQTASPSKVGGGVCGGVGGGVARVGGGVGGAAPNSVTQTSFVNSTLRQYLDPTFLNI